MNSKYTFSKWCDLQDRCKEVGVSYSPTIHASHIGALMDGHAVMVSFEHCRNAIIVPKELPFCEIIFWMKEAKMLAKKRKRRKKPQ